MPSDLTEPPAPHPAETGPPAPGEVQGQSTPSAKPNRRLWLAAGLGAVLLVIALAAYAIMSDPGERSEEGVAGMSVEVNAPAPPAPVPQSGGPLEVLAPDMVQQPLATAPPPPAPIEAEPEAAAVETPPDTMVHASFNCAAARPGAEQMVCADPSLAAADRDMARAYRRALRAGASPEDLRLEQRDWIALREDAARRSPQALAAIYFQRIDDLNGYADDR